MTLRRIRAGLAKQRTVVTMPAMRCALFVSGVLLAGCASGGVGGRGVDPVSSPRDQGSVQQTLNSLPGVSTLTPEPETATQEREIQAEAVPMEGSDLVQGRATVTVVAPIAEVRKAVLSFKDYPSFMPHCTGAKVLGRTPDGARDVYLDFEALHGAVKMWARIEAPKPVKDGDAEVIETRFVEGNVKDFRAIWRLRAIDPKTTELSFQVFIHPGLPVPSSLINEENLEGSVKGVTATRRWVETGRGKD
jgi:ribosome-associated toxin RatA of RatAB toxin-antitoxin module